MPVVLKLATWPEWLGEEPTDAADLKAILTPYPADENGRWPISPASWQRQEQRRALDRSPLLTRRLSPARR
jgi:putative SOS response-associated peptidase YedK